jgi:hypothetical protein
VYVLQIYDYELFAPAGLIVELNLAEAVSWLAASPRNALILRPGKPGQPYQARPRQVAVYRAATADLHDTDRYVLEAYPTGARKIYPDAYTAVMAGCEAGHR